jgi:hypothetical protein
MIAKTQKEADSAKVDVVGMIQTQKLITDTYKPTAPVDGLQFKEIKNPKEWIALDDIRTTTLSGPMLIRRGQHITHPRTIKILLDAKANIRAIK